MKPISNRQKPVVRAHEIWQKFALKKQQLNTVRTRQRKFVLNRKKK